MSVTLKEVAQRAGVSCSTASRALNGSPLVRLETRERVLAVAQAMGYQVNRVARGLVSQRTGTIGLILPSSSAPIFAELSEHVCREVHRRGYIPLLMVGGGEAEREEECLRLLYEHRVEGILLASGMVQVRAEEYVLELRERGVPIVLVNTRREDLLVDQVGGDEFEGGRLMTQHLLGLGHRHLIALANGLRSERFDRVHGFQRALEEAGFSPQNRVYLGVSSPKATREVLESLLLQTDAPTGLVCYSDEIAVWALKACYEIGRRVPEDVAIVGFDDVRLAHYVVPSLTTIAYPLPLMARQAVARLWELMEEGDTSPRTLLLPPRLVIRESCGARGKGGDAVHWNSNAMRQEESLWTSPLP